MFKKKETVSVIVVVQSNVYGVTILKVSLYLSVKFPKCWQCCSPHPNDEIFLFAKLKRGRKMPVKLLSILHVDMY